MHVSAGAYPLDVAPGSHAENYQPLQERAQWEGLARIYERGLAKEVGVSNFGPRQLEKIHRRLSEERGVPIASAQARA